MKTIAYFVTDSGFGHITRSTAIIRYILENSDYNIILISNRDQINHATIGLRQYEKRVSFANADTDANPVFYPNSLKVDVEKTNAAVKEYIDNLEDTMFDLYGLLKALNIDGVITDISILGIMIAKKMKVKCIGISNYTWYNRYKKFGLDQELLDYYKGWLDQLDTLIRLQFSDDMSALNCPIEDAGLVCREVNEMNSADFKKRYWPAVYMSVGQVEKKKEKFKINFPAGTIVATGNIEVEGQGHLVKLPPRVSHTQDYINACSFALIKGGWSSVAECLILGVPFGILEQDDSEDEELCNILFEQNLAFKTTEQELRDFNIKDMNIKTTTVERKKFNNDAPVIAARLVELIEK